MTVRTTQQPSATSCRHVSYLCYDCTGSTLASAISKHTNHPTHHLSTHHIHHLLHCSERNRILVHYSIISCFPVKMTPAKMAPVSANPSPDAGGSELLVVTAGAVPEDRGVTNSLCSQPFLGQRGSTKQETRTAHVEHSHRHCNPNEWLDGRRAQRQDHHRSLHLAVSGRPTAG
jgi:hypothetical protein